MMHNTSRRSFLNSLAILSAGTALPSVPGIFQVSAENAGTELQQLWSTFCKRNGGKKVTCISSLMEASLPPICKGHRYITGTAVRFSKQDLVAVPAWVYWPNHSEKPSDLVITFFKDRGQPQKILRMNRFELEGFSSYMGGNKKSSSFPAIFEKNDKGATVIKKTASIQTRISKGHQADIIARIGHETISFKKTIISNI